jgi:hypothetical protein
VVVVAALDRLGRRLVESVRAREEFKALGVATHSVRDGGEVGDLVANITAVVAQDEVDRIARRVREVRASITAKGWRPVGMPPLGYRLRDANDEERRDGSPRKVYELDPLTAPYVEEAFAQVARGESIRTAARWLASQSPEARNGKAMSYHAVRRMLLAPVYVARPDRGEADVLARRVGQWPQLVSDDAWRRVQARLAEHGRIPKQATGRYLLTGLIRCSACGSRMSGGCNRR